MEHLELAREIFRSVSCKYRPDLLSWDGSTLQSCEIYKQGNFTIALLNNKYVGATKRNPRDDRYNPKTGECTAITRAVKSMLEV